jgi:hypothetical protein
MTKHSVVEVAPVMHGADAPNLDAQSASPKWPERITFERLKTGGHHLSDRELQRIADDERKREEADKSLYRELVEGLRPIFPAGADHAQSACDAGYPFKLYAERLSEIMGAQEPADDVQSAWDAAFAALTTGLEASARTSAALDEAYATFDAAKPQPPAAIIEHENGKPTGGIAHEDELVCRYGATLAPEVLDGLREQARTYWAEYTRLSDEMNIEALEAADEDADAAIWAAHKALVATRAPDNAALALKLERVLRVAGVQATDPDSVGQAMTKGDPTLVGVLNAYWDAMRLAGTPSATEGVTAFEGQAWIEAYEAADVANSVTRYGIGRFDHPGGARIDPDTVTLYSERKLSPAPPSVAALTPWQKKVIFAAAGQREDVLAEAGFTGSFYPPRFIEAAAALGARLSVSEDGRLDWLETEATDRFMVRPLKHHLYCYPDYEQAVVDELRRTLADPEPQVEPVRAELGMAAE